MRLLNWENIVSGIVGAVLLSLIMWIFVVIGKVQNFLIPNGAIVAFAGECPNEEWTEYSLASNKFLMGTSDPRAAGTSGGDDKIVLTDKNLPKHNHKVHGTDHYKTPIYTDGSPDEYGTYIDNYTVTDWAGYQNPDPIPMIPLHVKVKFCIKK